MSKYLASHGPVAIPKYLMENTTLGISAIIMRSITPWPERVELPKPTMHTSSVGLPITLDNVCLSRGQPLSRYAPTLDGGCKESMDEKVMLQK